MTFKDYIEKHSAERNKRLFIGPIENDGPFCPECFRLKDELVSAPSNSPQCLNGHPIPTVTLASGGWA